MHTGILRSGFIFFLSFLLCVIVQAQQTRFVYIQTENKQPFYIKMNDSVFSSSGSGHIIISGLTDNEYKLVVGFANNEWPELNVTIKVKDTDAGFLLKHYNEGGWGMINLQSAEFLVMQRYSAVIKEEEEKTSGNEFARVLAAVVNDPSIAEVSIAKRITETAVKTLENKKTDIPVNDSSIAEVSVEKKITETPTSTPENKTIEIPAKDSTIAEVSAEKITDTATKVPENKEVEIAVKDSSIAEVSIPKKITDTTTTTPENKVMNILVNDSSIVKVGVAEKVTETAIKIPENKTMVITVKDSSITELSAAKKITETPIITPENKALNIPVKDSSIAEVSISKEITEPTIKTPENKTMVIPVKDSSIAEVSIAKEKTEPIIKTPENKTMAIPVKDSSSAEVSIAKKVTKPAIKTTESKTKVIPVNRRALSASVSKKGIVDSMGTRFINMELQNSNTKADSGSVKKDDFVIKEKKQIKVTESDPDKEVNLNCKRTATQSDFLKLRKLMAAQAGEQNMIKAAYKQFAAACYTTEQIKNLGVLFIVEEEKYKFYVAAFAYVIDRDNYGKLKDQFTDNYYKTRFSAMID